MAADAGHEDNIIERPAFILHLGQDILEGMLEREVAAARAPGVLDIRNERPPGHETASRTFARRFSYVNGRPSYRRIFYLR